MFNSARAFAAAHLTELCAEMIEMIENGGTGDTTRRMLEFMPDIPGFPAHKVAGQIIRAVAVERVAQGAMK